MTGVQTCALPICRRFGRAREPDRSARSGSGARAAAGPAEAGRNPGRDRQTAVSFFDRVRTVRSFFAVQGGAECGKVQPSRGNKPRAKDTRRRISRRIPDHSSGSRPLMARRHGTVNKTFPRWCRFRRICSKGRFRLFEINPVMGIKGRSSRLAEIGRAHV